MENNKCDAFFCDETFYSDMDSLCESLYDYADDFSDMDDDWQMECVGANLEPLFDFSMDWIADHVNEERFPEDDDTTGKRLTKLLNDNINFEAIAAGMPKIYYPS